MMLAVPPIFFILISSVMKGENINLSNSVIMVINCVDPVKHWKQCLAPNKYSVMCYDHVYYMSGTVFADL